MMVMRKNKPINVFLLDDEFPLDSEFRSKGVYNSAISTDDLFHLAINNEWEYHLTDLQQLIKDIATSRARNEGLINLLGFTSPTQALTEIKNGLIPDIIIYDWEYLNSPIYTSNSQNWLLEILNSAPNAFIFIYSKKRNELPKYLNNPEFVEFFPRLQLLEKGHKIKASFSSEEFILQYIIGSATNNGKIKINGVEIEFTANNYLPSASDILTLQRILGNQYVLDEMNKVDFQINDASVEKILNDSNGHVLYNEEKGILVSPDNKELIEQLKPLEEISYLDFLKKFDISKLEAVLERGMLKI